MTVRTANSALCDLSFEDARAVATVRKQRDFHAFELRIEVVKLQYDWVGLAAVDARMVEQVLEQPAIEHIGSFSDVAIFALDIERLLRAVVRLTVDRKTVTANAVASSHGLVGERKLLKRLEHAAHSALSHANTLRTGRHASVT
jgi:hypothetical protein